jgi:hypothetical protein
VHRQDQEAANATINRELAALKRRFRLAGKKVGQVPRFQMLRETTRGREPASGGPLGASATRRRARPEPSPPLALIIRSTVPRATRTGADSLAGLRLCRARTIRRNRVQAASLWLRLLGLWVADLLSETYARSERAGRAGRSVTRLQGFWQIKHSGADITDRVGYMKHQTRQVGLLPS